MTINEFDIINKYFRKQIIKRDDVILDIGDDCAIVQPPQDTQLAITTDTLNAGIHFPIATNAFDIGFKSLAVNLSDLAAMGAAPAWATLSLTLPKVDETWLQEFSKGFFELANRYNVQLIGGDLTHGPLAVTVEAFGFVPKNKFLTRRAAKPGDLIYVTNNLGDAALALDYLTQKRSISIEFQEAVLQKLNRPEPQIEAGKKLLEVAQAAIDISDGLAADLGHILEESQVGAVVYVDQIPLSDALRKSATKEEAISLALNGGDDYELCFTVPKEKQHLVDPKFICIGEITEKLGLHLQFSNGRKYEEEPKGYKHF